MKPVSLKDNLFSISRGRFFETIKIILTAFFKNIVFKVLNFCTIFSKRKSFECSLVQRIMIYIPVSSGIGDLIMSNLFFKSIREKFPNSKIIVCSKFGIFIDNKYYDELIDIKSMSLLKQISMIESNKIDLFLLPEKSLSSSIIYLLCKTRFKLGYLDSYQLIANFKIPRLEFVPHHHHYYIKSFNLILVFEKDSTANIPTYAPDLSYFDLPQSKISHEYILFTTQERWGTRSVSFEYAKMVIEEVMKSSYHIYLCGGQESVKRNLELIDFFKQFKDRILFQEELSLVEFAKVVQNSKGVICNDGGPMHIAYGFKKPVLSFWGPTFPEHILPLTANPKSFIIFEKENCQVKSCYNMEHKPFCKSCLRLEVIPNFSQKINSFINSLSS